MVFLRDEEVRYIIRDIVSSHRSFKGGVYQSFVFIEVASFTFPLYMERRTAEKYSGCALWR